MIKILLLQQLSHLAVLGYPLLGRRSFLQFLELTESSSIPDAKTIWLFRDRLAQAGAVTRGRLVTVVDAFTASEIDVHAVWPRAVHLRPKVRHVVDALLALGAKGRLDADFG